MSIEYRNKILRGLAEITLKKQKQMHNKYFILQINVNELVSNQ